MKGQNLRLFLGTPALKCVGAATKCQYHVANATEENTTKDTDGDWTSKEIVSRSWDLSSDSLVVADAPHGAAWSSISIIQEAIVGKTPVGIEFDLTNGTNNAQKVQGGTLLAGKAIITDMTLSAENRKNNTLSIKMEGVGALTLATSAPHIGPVDEAAAFALRPSDGEEASISAE